MTATTPVSTFVAGAAIIGSALLLALPLVAAPSRAADSIRTIEVTLSRYAFSPARIEIRLGERVRLHVVSADGPHGFRVKALGLNVRTPARQAATVEVTPTKAGTFEVSCSEYCGTGHSRMKASLIVTPGT